MNMKRIFVIDDDLAMEAISDAFHYRGHDACRISSASTALGSVNEIAVADLVILDIIMPWPAEVPVSSLGGNQTAGMEVYRSIRGKNPKVPIIAYSGTQDGAVIATFQDDPATKFLSKWESHSLKELLRSANELLGLTDVPAAKVFIVHGHDETTKLALKNFLQNKLHLPEPVILHEQPSLGRTVIEKFEDYAY
jgi:CheY-like chemotaxis protein